MYFPRDEDVTHGHIFRLTEFRVYLFASQFRSLISAGPYDSAFDFQRNKWSTYNYHEMIFF